MVVLAETCRISAIQHRISRHANIHIAVLMTVIDNSLVIFDGR